MAKSLLIVESPTKARTISRFLDSDSYIVESSYGHIRDLPNSAAEIPADVKDQRWTRLGINVADAFQPLYVVPQNKREQVSKLKASLREVDAVYLATDEDREGEAISWHLMEVLKPKVPAKRLVFHEITREAIEAALKNPREIDEGLVMAQETRRKLDRLYGYEVSPVLWRKIGRGLSAGRVQSVALRILVNRERERMAFHQADYWDLAAQLHTGNGNGGGEFEAVLHSVDGQRVALGRDFDAATGALLEGRGDVRHLDQAAAEALRAALNGQPWSVRSVEQKAYTSKPPAPFITSTLQQEANRKLGLSSRDCMRLAQGLYENGHITYMRTDSTTLSEQAIKAARAQITAMYGANYMPAKPRVYTSKVKNAQEAHEAIRPAGESFRTPDELRGSLNDGEWKLYDLIWKRTIASQMEDARGQRQTVQITVGDAVFQATGRTIEFPGYRRAYVEGSDDPQAELGEQERILPAMKEGDNPACRALETREHSTQPPARFSEASIIKELEKEGIGRPSTYAAIIGTILERDYAFRDGRALVPTFTGIAVVRLMEQFFTDLVDVGFTAEMENVLDAISRGEREWLPYLKSFYFGEKDYAGLENLLKAQIDPRAACTIPLEVDRQEPISVRIGRYGPYLEQGTERASLPHQIPPDMLTAEKARELLAAGSQDEELGVDPDNGQPVLLKVGRFGPYVERTEPDGELKRKGLFKGMLPEQVTLEAALKLLSLPRSLGVDPETDEEVMVDLGRYGPYARRGKDSRSLRESDDLFAVTMEEMQALFKLPKKFGRQAATLKDLGKHPETGVPIELKAGRFGPYVTDGEINASVPRNTDPDQVRLEDAIALLKDRAAKGPPKKRGKAAAKKPAAKKTAAKKTAGAKTAAKKTVAKKKPAAKKSAAAKTAAATAEAKPAKKPTVRKKAAPKAG